MNRILTIGLVAALALLLGSCEYKKYTEGPLTTVFPADFRLERTWTWALALEEGDNVTGVLADSTIEFQSNQVVRICPVDGGDCREGTWALVTRRTKLNLIFGKSAEAFDIQRLTQSEVYLQSTEANVDTYWELNAVE